MRVAIEIPDTMHRALKREAARRRMTLSEVILERLSTPRVKKRRIDLPLIRGSRRGKVNLTNAKIEELLR